jgi:Domain of unknown function (DUF397)
MSTDKAPLGKPYKSSFSGSMQTCVVVEHLSDGSTQVTDSKDPGSPGMTYTADEWTAFLKGVRNGEMDHPNS